MRSTIIYFVILIVAVMIGVRIAHDPGYAVFHYQHWTISMPLWLAAVIMIVVFSILFYVLHLLEKTRSIMQHVKIWRLQRAEKKAFVQSQCALRVLSSLGQQDWDHVLTQLPTLEQHRTLPATALSTLYLQAYQHHLQKSEHNRDTLQAYFKNLPRRWRYHPDIITCYAERLLALKADDVAESVLRDALKKQWHADHVRLYGLTVSTHLNKQLQYAQKWLKAHPEDSVLLLACGQIALRLNLWGLARDYLEKSARLTPRKITYQLLAELSQRCDEKEKTIHYYKRATTLP